MVCGHTWNKVVELSGGTHPTSLKVYYCPTEDGMVFVRLSSRLFYSKYFAYLLRSRVIDESWSEQEDCTWDVSRMIHRKLSSSAGPLLFGLQTCKGKEATGRKRPKPDSGSMLTDRLMTNSPSSIEPNCGVFWRCKNARPVSAPDHSSIASNSRNGLSSSSEWTM